jgi:hypothetical protein
MNRNHTAQCRSNADTLVTEELHLQGLWDATYVDGDDLRIPAWGMTVRNVVDMWLSEGTVTCRCDEQLEEAHTEALAEDRARTAAAVQNVRPDMALALAGVDLPPYYGRPIDTPTGHRWAGPAPSASCDTAGSSGRRAAVRQNVTRGRERLAAAVRNLPPAGTVALC